MKQIPHGIKNIIFDLGGVLLDLNVDLSIRTFRKLGMPDLIKPGGWSYQHQVFLDMEQGLLSDEEFRDGIRSLLPRPASNEAIDAAWCAMLVDFAPEKIDLLQMLRSTFKLYLFSNTNKIHMAYFHNLFKSKFNFALSELFVKDYYSSEIKLRKPSLESFKYVLDDAGIIPSETLFIDDSSKNIEGAKNAGLHALWLHPERNLLSVFGV